jgi:DNA polymerase-1
MPEKKQKFIIIDGNAILHRAWHALPPLTTKNGELINAAYGFTMILLKIIKDFKPTHLAATFDRRAPTFRHAMYKEYKATRVKQPQELYDQIPHIKDILAGFNIPIYEKDGYEADDLIATICSEKSIDNPETLSIVVTGDLDTLQLVDDNTEVLALKKGVTDTFTYNEETVKERYGLAPLQLIDLKSLRGDPSDNIPGIRGIGEKTAIEIIKEFGSLENLYEALDKKDPKIKTIKERYLKLIKEQKDIAFLSKKLVILNHHAPIDFNLEDCRLKSYDKNEIFKLFQELGFKSLLNKLPAGGAQTSLFGDAATNLPQPLLRKEGGIALPLAKGESEGVLREKFNYQLVDTEEKFNKFYEELKNQTGFAVDTETTGLDPFSAELLGISFAWVEGSAYYLDIKNQKNKIKEDWLEKLKKILENEKIEKYGHNMKYDMAIIKNEDIEVKPTSFDTMIASYLLNPGSRAHNIDDLSFAEFGHEKIHIVDLIGKGKDQISMAEVPVEKVSDYSCEDADFAYRLVNRLEPELRKNNLLELFKNIEMPLVPVLENMERNGVKINVDFLNKFKKETEKRKQELEAKIYELAGTNFNINSPQQLKAILFEKLEISTIGIGKTKTGISTAAEELEKLRGKHPIIDFIFEYRELSKLISTYIEALPELVNAKTGRVHTSYNQTVTATGRLSSSNPNLQNIPTRTELGQRTRQAFIAEPGYKIVSADYSQIELRVIASLANDPIMIKAFESGEDIHTKTASEIWGVKSNEVKPEMRRAAKTINFGVTYGMGPRGLALSAGISLDEAREFIEKYFELYNGVKNFLDETVIKARETGYVETLFGRRRYLPEINSSVPRVRNAAERMAINMPVQGTAADLMKMAMIRLNTRINTNFDEYTRIHEQPIKMIMQVHDELVFEVKEDAIDEAIKMIKDEMENVYKLKAPIKVDIEIGDNWGELKKYGR